MCLLPKVRVALYGGMALCLASCSTFEPERKAQLSNLVDPKIVTAAAGEGGWNYHRSGEADLNGDGLAEKVVLAAEVELARGRPAWSDGHHWQVYVESPSGELTSIYAQRLQLGTLTLRLTEGREILLTEHLPDSLHIYQISYTAPGDTSAKAVLTRRLDPRGDLASPRFP